MAAEALSSAENNQTAIANNLARLEEAIATACRAANRPRSEIELIAVSKTHPASAIADALAIGLHRFGENRVQEFQAKSLELPSIQRSQIQAHLIGHLQSNKAATAARIFDAIDSVDSLKLALKLDESASALAKTLPILLEIKLSSEPTKAGLAPDSLELAQLLDRLSDLNHLNPQGLMTIAPLDVPEAQTRACFRALRSLRDRIAQTHLRLDLPVLSMGMSGDFPLAIAEGSTRIRIGTALFGQRSPQAKT